VTLNRGTPCIPIYIYIPIYIPIYMYIGHSAMKAYPSSLKIRQKSLFETFIIFHHTQRYFSLTFLAKNFSVLKYYKHPVRVCKFSDATWGFFYFLLFGGLIKRFWEFAKYSIHCNLKHTLTAVIVKQIHSSTCCTK